MHNNINAPFTSQSYHMPLMHKKANEPMLIEDVQNDSKSPNSGGEIVNTGTSYNTIFF